MITLNDISILIVTKLNNINRFLYIINRIKSLYPTIEIVTVFDDIEEKEELKNLDIISIYTKHRVYVSGGYNLAIEKSTKPCFVFLHDDTIICKYFIENLIKNINIRQFCNFTQIEPPVYTQIGSTEKPILDLGRNTDQFDINALDVFYESYIKKLPHKTKPSPYGGFFMAGYKESFLSVGGFDESFQPFFHEDADLMVRLLLNGYKFIQSFEACVYHMVSLTSRDNKEEEIYAHNTTANIFFKKWGISFDTFKTLTIDQNIPYKKPNYKIETNNLKSSFDQISSYDKDKPYSTVFVDQSYPLTQLSVQIINTLPYYINYCIENNISKFQQDNILIDVKA